MEFCVLFSISQWLEGSLWSFSNFFEEQFSKLLDGYMGYPIITLSAIDARDLIKKNNIFLSLSDH